MLTELNISQFGLSVNCRKRWFQDDYFDLFTWQSEQGDVVIFQLCYDRLGKERVIIWDNEQGFAHHCVDDGEASPNKNMTPVFISVARFSYEEVVTPFIQESQQIDETIRHFITQKLIEYTNSFSKGPMKIIKMTFIYLHGWASGPFSNKARFFSQRFAQQGLTLQTPDLNQDDFFHLTLSRQVQQIKNLLPNRAVTLIGSSFGGLTALWVAEQQPQVERLVLLAPALEFSARCLTLVPEAQQIQWREQGVLNLYHYAEERELPLSYNFIEDLQQYHDDHLQRHIPTLILHGIHDEVVPIQASRNFIKTHPWVELIELESDHSLASVQEQLWQALYSFCQLNPTF